MKVIQCDVTESVNILRLYWRMRGNQGEEAHQQDHRWVSPSMMRRSVAATSFFGEWEWTHGPNPQAIAAQLDQEL